MQLPNIKNAKEIAAGGEGRILEHPTDKSKVIKIYHLVRPYVFIDHLKVLSKLPKTFVKPIDIYDDGVNVLGFSMDYVNLNDYWLFNNLFNKGFCTSNSITINFKIKVLTSLRKELEKIHKLGIVVGDLNQYNLFVSKRGDILFVDVDSYATTSQPHSGVLIDEIRDWTTPNISDKTDAWAFDILAFWSTTHCHPFKWVVPGNTETLEQRVRNGKSILTKIPGVKIPPLYVPPTGHVLDQFNEVFKGRRYMVDFQKATMPIPVIIPQVPITSDLTIREIFKNVTEINSAVNQFALKANGEWHLFVSDITKITREVEIVPIVKKATSLYPATAVGEFAYTIAGTLYTKEHTFVQSYYKPSFYYSLGALTVVDYAEDEQWNYEISRQLAGTIQGTMLPVFAKSIIFRGAPIQNFGKMRKLNVPYGHQYALIPIHEDTKDAFYCRHFAAAEIKTKRTTLFELSYTGKKIKDLDYLPHFAVMGILAFIPGDGFIEIVNATGNVISRMNVSNCTRTSQLHYTTSGILMLENNILYLLNTK